MRPTKLALLIFTLAMMASGSIVNFDTCAYGSWDAAGHQTCTYGTVESTGPDTTLVNDTMMDPFGYWVWSSTGKVATTSLFVYIVQAEYWNFGSKGLLDIYQYDSHTYDRDVVNVYATIAGDLEIVHDVSSLTTWWQDPSQHWYNCGLFDCPEQGGQGVRSSGEHQNGTWDIQSFKNGVLQPWSGTYPNGWTWTGPDEPYSYGNSLTSVLGGQGNSDVPEPATSAMLGVTLIALGFGLRHSRRL